MRNVLLTEAQASKALNVKMGTLRTWRARKQGPKAIRLGRLVRYPLADLQAFAGGLPLDVPEPETEVPGKGAGE